MGKRKLRFDCRKNYERKRAKQQAQFIVSLPLNSYTNSVVVNLSHLSHLQKVGQSVIIM